MTNHAAIPCNSAADNRALQSASELTARVSELSRRYYRTVAPDATVRTAADRHYLLAIVFTTFGLIFPPLLIGTVWHVCHAKKLEKSQDKKGGRA